MKYVQIVTIDNLPPMNNVKDDDPYSYCIFTVNSVFEFCRNATLKFF